MNRVLDDAGFDAFVGEQCAKFYADGVGRRSRAPRRWSRERKWSAPSERRSAVTGWTKTRRGEADRKFLREWPDLGGVPVTDALVERADALAWEHGLRAYDSGSARGHPRVSRTWLDTGSAHARPDCSWKRCPIQTRYMWCSTNCAEFGAFRLPLTET